MPVTIPRNEELAKQARALYVPGVFGVKRVAKALGTSETTVRRYVNPAFAERNRILSREAKLRRTGICENCGGITRYNGRTVAGASPVCKACNDFTIQETCKNGHPLIPENRVKNGRHTTCRLCRNAYMREFHRRQRRARGVPEYGEYRRPKEEALIARLKSEGEAQT